MVTQVVSRKNSISGIWDEIDHLNPQHESSSKKINDFLVKFVGNLKNNTCGAYLIRTGSGVSDITLLGRRDATSLENKTHFKFILKYIFPPLCANTIMCSKAFELLDLNSPKIYPLNTSKSNQAKVNVAKVMNLKNSIHGRGFAFMKAFEGAELGDLLATGAFFKLDKSSLETIFKTFGKVAVFDLMIGNDDRFFRPIVDLPCDQMEPFVNKGNIMLELAVISDTERQIKNIFCIDNTSSQRIKPSKKETDYPDERQEYLDKFKEMFSYFYNPDKQHIFAEIIYAGILTATPDEFKNKGDIFDHNELINFLKIGIQEGYHQLSQQKNLVSFLQSDYFSSLPQDNESKLFCNKILELIQYCLNVV